MQAFSPWNRCIHKDGSKVSQNKSTNTYHVLTFSLYSHSVCVYVWVCWERWISQNKVKNDLLKIKEKIIVCQYMKFTQYFFSPHFELFSYHSTFQLQCDSGFLSPTTEFMLFGNEVGYQASQFWPWRWFVPSFTQILYLFLTNGFWTVNNVYR